MFISIFLKRIIPFAVSLVAGLLLADALAFKSLSFEAQSNQPILHVSQYPAGSGSSSHGKKDSTITFPDLSTSRSGTNKTKIISKPKAVYTEEARANAVEGDVTLKVALLGSGQVGSITPIQTLPYGLTEKAIEAARKIVFLPATKDGTSKSVVVTIRYSFTIY